MFLLSIGKSNIVVQLEFGLMVVLVQVSHYVLVMGIFKVMFGFIFDKRCHFVFTPFTSSLMPLLPPEPSLFISSQHDELTCSLLPFLSHLPLY